MAAAVTRACCVIVPHHARAARLARYRLAGELAGVIAPELLGDAIAVVAELVGNAVRHARPLPGRVIKVSWRLEPPGQALEVRVTDGGGTGRPRQRRSPPDAVDGRGLAIVAALADRWGVDLDGDAQSVWARLGGRYDAAAV